MQVADKKSSKECREEKFAKHNSDNGNATLKKGWFEKYYCNIALFKFSLTMFLNVLVS